MGAKQQEYTVIPGGEAGGIFPPEGCSRESRKTTTLHPPCIDTVTHSSLTTVGIRDPSPLLLLMLLLLLLLMMMMMMMMMMTTTPSFLSH